MRRKVDLVQHGTPVAGVTPSIEFPLNPWPGDFFMPVGSGNRYQFTSNGWMQVA